MLRSQVIKARSKLFPEGRYNDVHSKNTQSVMKVMPLSHPPGGGQKAPVCQARFIAESGGEQSPMCMLTHNEGCASVKIRLQPIATDCLITSSRAPGLAR